MIDERLGSYIGDTFFSLIVFAIMFFAASYIFKNVVIPIFNRVRGWQELRGTGFWDPATMVFVIFFVGLLVVFIDTISLKIDVEETIEDLQMIEEHLERCEVEQAEEIFKKIRE